MSMTDVECPYCGAGQEICHDDGFGYEEGVKHEMDCSECDKAFVFETSILFCYEAMPADCLNDGEHQFEPTRVFPVQRTKMECVFCGWKRPCDADEMAEVMRLRGQS